MVDYANLHRASFGSAMQCASGSTHLRISIPCSDRSCRDTSPVSVPVGSSSLRLSHLFSVNVCENDTRSRLRKCPFPSRCRLIFHTRGFRSSFSETTDSYPSRQNIVNKYPLTPTSPRINSRLALHSINSSPFSHIALPKTVESRQTV
jgi:hypothetical protein